MIEIIAITSIIILLFFWTLAIIYQIKTGKRRAPGAKKLRRKLFPWFYGPRSIFKNKTNNNEKPSNTL